MRLKNLFFIVIMLVSTSFNLIKPDKSSLFIDEDTLLFHPKFLFSDSNQIAYFECEDFVSDALNKYTIANINQELNSLHCFKELFINKHDSAVVDTIYTFSNAENIIQIYRTSENDFIFTFEVTDSIFKLAGNIKPCMAKDAFFRKFNITENRNNKLQIANSEGSIKFMFYFENNRLKRISSYLYLD